LPVSGSRSLDSLLGGAITFAQPRTGYRVNVDSLLLAKFAQGSRRARLAVDLGAGVGVLSLLLHHHGTATKFALLEREAALAELARENLERGGASGEVLQRDLALDGLPPALVGRADLVISNPPYFVEGDHRAPKNSGRRRARQGGLEPFVAGAARALNGTRARAVFVYPARALTELLACAQASGLVPKRLRLVHPLLDRPARIALVELRKAKPGGLVVEPPLVEWERPGRASRELESITRG
jgi:tRNA1Val (adenine37-N6)-methyltransferase